MLVRLARLVALGVAIAVAAELIRAVARAAGANLEFRYHNEAGILMVYAVAALGVVAFARLAWGVSLRAAAARHWTHRRRVLLGFLLTLSVTVAALLLLWAVAAWAGVAVWHASRWQRWGWWMAGRTLAALGTALLVAVVEECIFRGLAFGYLRDAGNGARSSLAGAVLGSAMIFALAHRLDDPAGWLSPHGPPLFVGLALLGVLLAVTYHVTGSLACAAGLHAGLLLVEVFARNRGTRLVLVSQPGWWMGVNGDLRTAPVCWALFVASTLVVWRAGFWLAPVTAVPPDPAPALTVSRNVRTTAGVHGDPDPSHPRRQERGD